MAFYINDSIFGSIFFFLTGLHFFHVVVGIILISIILGIVSIVSLPPASPNQATLHRLCDAGRRGSETKRTFRCSPLGGNLRILPLPVGPEVEVVSSVRLAFPGVERLIIFTHRSTPDSKHARREDELTFNSQPRT